MPDCVLLTPKEVREINWLPPTCAYDLLAKGKDLYWWHPLVSGDPDTVHIAGISVRGRVGACESRVPDEELENWIVKWPGTHAQSGGEAGRVQREESLERASARNEKEGEGLSRASISPAQTLGRHSGAFADAKRRRNYPESSFL